MEIDRSYIYNGATEKGTRVIEKGKELDKNSFFKLLAAQLQNQDPSNPADSSQFIAQLAQFTTLEEMENMNQSLEFKNADALVGKTVAFDSYNYKGEQLGGMVKSIEQTATGPQLLVDILEGNDVVEKKFKLDDVSNVFYNPNPYLTSLNGNFDFYSVSNMIGKTVKASSSDGNYQGDVKSVYKSSQGVVAVIETTGKVISKEMTKKESFNESNVYLNGVYKDADSIRIKLKYEVSGDDGVYKYMVIRDGDNEDELQWNEYVADTEFNGLKMLLPEENPDLPCNWEINVEGFKSEEKHFSSGNILEVGE